MAYLADGSFEPSAFFMSWVALFGKALEINGFL